MIDSKALVLSKVRYGDTSLIVKCFTKELGLRSYLLKGVLSSKKSKLRASYFQHLTLLEITVSDKSNAALGFIRDVKVLDAFHATQTDPIKRTITLFLAEILTSCFQEESSNTALFDYIEASLKWLDSHEHSTNFHLLFLLRLTRYLGFYPDASNDHLPFFDMQEVMFAEQQPYHSHLSGQELDDFRQLLGTNFDALSSLNLSAKRRTMLLDALIRYFQLHLHGFKKPRSLAVLSEVFNS